jgi:hypothetical protein
MKKVEFSPILSSRRRPGSSDFGYFWTPAFAGVTGFGTFYGFIKTEGGTKAIETKIQPKPLPSWLSKKQI